VDSNHQGNTIPISTYNILKYVFLLEGVLKIDAQGSMTLEGGFLDNYMMYLQACASTKGLFPCWEAIDPSNTRQTAFPLVGLLHNDIACWGHTDQEDQH